MALSPIHLGQGLWVKGHLLLLPPVLECTSIVAEMWGCECRTVRVCEIKAI